MGIRLVCTATSGAWPHLLVVQEAEERVADDDAGEAEGAEERAVVLPAHRLQLEVP